MTFPIVALGASAGGLEAVSEFLAALPASSEMAYVVVQHLDPTHKSLSAEIWSRRTSLPVLNIQDEGVIEPGHVYVIPPKTTLTLEQDRFKLAPRQPGQHHPVDIFFNSLAEARGDAAIGVVLSGGDSDGSLGVRAIKHSGGITFAQEPKSARFPSMPQNAIATGCIDFVLPPQEIAQELERLSVHPYLRPAPQEGETSTDAEAPSEEEQLKRVFRRLRATHGVDFTHYKRSTLRRRLARRMAVRQLQDLADYIAVMEDDAGETAALYQDFLIRVTGFFRDPEVFEGLRDRVFPSLCESRSPKEPIRIWVPGCASGEEVYSIAIALMEFMGDQVPSSGVQIFGTDVSEVEIEKARTGRYLANISEEISEERLMRFFVKEDEHYRIAKSIRDLCIFARQDVTRDPPFSRLDLLSCRNVLIYFDARAQRHVMQVFHYSLKPEGFLMLGPSETVGPASDLFELVDREHRLYTRKAGLSLAAERAQRELPQVARLGRAEEGPESAMLEQDSTQLEGDRLLLTRYAPATLFIDDDLNILQYRGETARFLEHASGPVSNQLQRVVRPELMVEIAPALAEARGSSMSVRREGLILDDLIDVSIEVVPLKARSRNGFLIIFEDASRRPGGRRTAPAHPLPESEKDRRLGQLEREMNSTRDFLQATIEGQEAVKEELKSAHEEVLSANEEFQSTNEELETAKEELQSTNEELTTTNDELRDRNRELSVLNAEIDKARGIAQRARSYADGIVATVRDALVVLDGNLKVLRANPAYYDRFKAKPEDTEGQPFAGLVEGRWNIPELLQRLKATLATNTDVIDYEMDHASTQGPRKLLFNARRIVGDADREQLILLAIEDVTERSQLLEAEQIARTEAERANRAKDEFLATVSHELRTPITIIVGWSRLLIKKHGDTNEELRKSLNLIISNAMGQAQIISDLLDMSSILSGKSVMHLTPVDLKNSIAECVAAHQLQAKEREIALILEQTEEPAVVIADPARLQQVFGNLLTNALKFTPLGGKITARQVAVADSFEVSIEDTGEGIAPDFLPQIFTRFRQEGEPGARHGGLGLGLAIVNQIIQMLDGSVTAHSEGRGLGARFTVRLPAHSPTSGENFANSIDEEVSGYSAEGLQGVTALVVEDNVDMLEFLLRILEERGALVIGVRTAGAALEALSAPQRHSFNVLISDIGLPGIDGYELIRRVRTDLKLTTERFPAIAVTAFGRKEDRQRALDSGFQAHLSKPYEVTHLVAALRKLRADGSASALSSADPQS